MARASTARTVGVRGEGEHLRRCCDRGEMIRRAPSRCETMEEDLVCWYSCLPRIRGYGGDCELGFTLGVRGESYLARRAAMPLQECEPTLQCLIPLLIVPSHEWFLTRSERSTPLYGTRPSAVTTIVGSRSIQNRPSRKSRDILKPSWRFAPGRIVQTPFDLRRPNTANSSELNVCRFVQKEIVPWRSSSEADRSYSRCLAQGRGTGAQVRGNRSRDDALRCFGGRSSLAQTGRTLQ